MVRTILRAFVDFLYEIFETLILSAAIFLLLYFFLVRPHQVKGDSMVPNFHDGEYLLTERLMFHILKKPLNRGEVVVFKAPENNQVDFIKRVLGLPGEKILLEEGKIRIINAENPQGFPLNEDYLSGGTQTFGKRTIQEGQPFEIPPDNYIVMGDNRERSSDSREWGLVPRANIVGKVWLRYWPPNVFGMIRRPEY